MSQPKLIMLDNSEAELQPGDILRVTKILGTVAVLQMIEPVVTMDEVRELPPNTLGISVSDGIRTKEKIG